MSGDYKLLRPYQKEAVAFLKTQDKAMVLAPVGAGKTAITITAMKQALADKRVNRWLVLAPKRVATDVWPSELDIWGGSLSFSVAVGLPAQRQEALESGSDVLIVNYDNLQWLCAQNFVFDGIVFDELTKLKNPSGKRFKALDKRLPSITVRWGLTGSFTSNGLEDVFGQCKIIDGSLLGRSKSAFLEKHFVLINPEYGEWLPKPKALEEVMHKIKPATYLLEPGEYNNVVPPLNTVRLLGRMPMAEYKSMKTQMVLELGDQVVQAVNAAVVTSKLQQLTSGFIYASDQTADPLLPGKFNVSKSTLFVHDKKFALLDETLEENQRANTIVVYNYQEELHQLKKRYPHAVTLDTPDAVKKWNDGKVSMLLIHPKSAGHGLNLQHGGHHMIFFSLPWSLELFEQTIGRLHRSGQKHGVWVYALVMANTIDENIWSALANKKSVAEIAIGALR
jgi:SNF2 family DNA or RNA helicase